MHYTYIIPNWFFGFDIAMEVLFCIITLMVAAVALKINYLTKDRKTKLFGISFLLIAISYIIWAGINIWFVNLSPEGIRALSIQSLAMIGVLSLYAYMILFTGGLATLAYLTSDKKSGKIYYLIFGLSLLVIFASLDKLISFRILSLFLISVIAFHYFEDYFAFKNKKSSLILIAFLLLFFSSLVFIFSDIYYQAYVVGHILELVSYALVLITLIKSVKK